MCFGFKLSMLEWEDICQMEIKKKKNKTDTSFEKA